MRAKYTLYRSDADLRAMHAQHAFLPLWDDHEFRNNYSKDNWSLPELFFQEKSSAPGTPGSSGCRCRGTPVT